MSDNNQNLFSTTKAQSNDSENSFGTGFILGAAFASLTLFFLATKTGRELAKKISSGKFDTEKFSQSLKEILEGTFENSESYNTQEKQPGIETSVFEEQEINTSHTPILRRRFFFRRK